MREEGQLHLYQNCKNCAGVWRLCGQFFKCVLCITFWTEQPVSSSLTVFFSGFGEWRVRRAARCTGVTERWCLLFWAATGRSVKGLGSKCEIIRVEGCNDLGRSVKEIWYCCYRKKWRGTGRWVEEYGSMSGKELMLLLQAMAASSSHASNREAPGRI